MKNIFHLTPVIAWATAGWVSAWVSIFPARAISLDDIPLWTGSGTNRAALVIEWNSPEIFNGTTVPAPVTGKTLVWGYRFNGAATGTQMFNAIAASDPRLYAVENTGPSGTIVAAIGYNLDGRGFAGLTDGTGTNLAGTFSNGILIKAALNMDAARSLDSGDLYWGGTNGPHWQMWTETNDSGGWAFSPNRGSSPYWDTNTYTHGQWASATQGMDGLPLTDGSWLGFSVTAAGQDLNPNDPAYYAFINDEEAPPSPDGTYVAYICNTNDFAVQIVSTNNVDPSSPYNDPTAMLNRPTLQFYDPIDGGSTDLVSIINDAFNVTPQGSNVLTEISSGGQVTVKLGRKVYDDPGNPYGVDLIVYGNSFFTALGVGGPISDGTDLDVAKLSTGFGGHATIVSVSQDGTNWYTFTNTQTLYPDNTYRWDDTNASWTAEEMNPTKPLNPYIRTNTVSGQTVASGLDQFTGAAGGSGYALKGSGLPWIQYVRLQPGAGTYTVIDAIAAVNPVAVGDALSIAPDNLASGISTLMFQAPFDGSQNQITINFTSLSAVARISTVSLNDLSSFAPVEGNISSACQIMARPLGNVGPVTFSGNIGLRAGAGYAGNGSDLRVFQWSGTNWVAQPFIYSATNNEVQLAGVTNFSAFVVSQIAPPRLGARFMTNGCAFQFVPVPNCPETLLRSTNFVAWTPVCTFTATNNQPVILQDTNPPASRAFYRLQLNP